LSLEPINAVQVAGLGEPRDRQRKEVFIAGRPVGRAQAAAVDHLGVAGALGGDELPILALLGAPVGKGGLQAVLGGAKRHQNGTQQEGGKPMGLHVYLEKGGGQERRIDSEGRINPFRGSRFPEKCASKKSLGGI
jgi:hypothetical protein